MQTVLDYAELFLLVAGSTALLGIIVELTRRRQWKDALRLPPPPAHRLDLTDVLLGLLAIVVFPSFCASLARTAVSAGSGDVAGSMPATPAPSLPISAGLLVGQMLTAGGMLWIGLRAFGSGAAWGLRPVRPGRHLLTAVAAFVVVLPLCVGLLYLVHEAGRWLVPGYQPAEHAAIQALGSHVSPWIRVLTACGAVVAAPVYEELFFRGILQPALARAGRSPWVGIVLTGLLFGAFHHAVPDTMLPLALFGVVLGFVAAKSGSLIPAILLHAVFNARTVAAVLLAPSS